MFTSHNIFLCQRIIHRKVLTLFNSSEAERGEEATKEREKFEASRSWFMRFKGKSHAYNIKVHDVASTEKEAAASYPEGLVKILIESGYTKQQIVNVNETALYWRYHLRLS